MKDRHYIEFLLYIIGYIYPDKIEKYCEEMERDRDRFDYFYHCTQRLKKDFDRKWEIKLFQNEYEIKEKMR